MNPVNHFKCGGRMPKHGGLMPVQGGQNPPEKPVVHCARQMNKHMSKTKSVPEIAGVDFLAEREQPSKPIAGPFYTDQIDMLVDTARVLRDRVKQGLVFIAPAGVGFKIFKRKAVRA